MKILRNFLLLISAFIYGISCQTAELEQLNENVRILVNITDEEPTRVSEDGSNFVEGDKIKVVNTSRENSNVAIFTFNESDNDWITSDVILWNAGTSNDFKAWHPVSASFDTFTISSDQSEGLGTSDWMTAFASATPSDGGVALSFKRHLAKVKVSIAEWGDEYDSTDKTIQKLELRSLAATLTKNEQSLVGDDNSLLVQTYKNNQAFIAIIAPGIYSEGDVFMQVYINGDSTPLTVKTAEQLELKAGKAYELKLIIGRDCMTIAPEGISVTDWDDEELEDQEILVDLVDPFAPLDPSLPPYNEIWYTSTTGSIVPLMSSAGFGADVVSNTYENGKGIIKFDGRVTAIGANAYFNSYSPNKTLETVTIPTSVTSIGELAFNSCWSLKDINLHDGITHIGERAFIYTALTEVTIPKGLTELSKQVFDSTPLKSIVIPNNIKKIGERAFCLCKNLETVVIGDGVEEIELCAFETWETKLVSITLGKNVTKMGSNVFYGCTGKLIITGNIPYTSSNANSYQNDWIYGADFTEIVIGDDVEIIPNYAFYCYDLPLTRLTIGRGVKSIGKSILHSPIAEINVIDLEKYCKIDMESIIMEDAKLFVDGVNTTSVTIPDGITQVKPHAFEGCANMKYLTIPDSVTEIGDEAFSECESLISVNGAKNLQTIGNTAFGWCSSLTYMPITTNLTSIGESAFRDCTKLSLSESPVNAKSIGKYAFYECENLVYSLNLKSATSIGQCAFYGCSGINVVDAGSAIQIGSGAFCYCSKLTQVVLNDELTRIESSTFKSTSLKIVDLPKNLQYIGEAAFASSGLTSVTIPQGVTYIDCYAFEYNKNLSSVYCMPTTPPQVGTEYDEGDRYWDAFDGSADDCIIYVPSASVSAYKTANYWSEYSDKIVGKTY